MQSWILGSRKGDGLGEGVTESHPLGIPVGSSWLPQAFHSPGVARKRGTTYRGRSAREPGGVAQHPAERGRVHEIESPLTYM